MEAPPDYCAGFCEENVFRLCVARLRHGRGEEDAVVLVLGQGSERGFTPVWRQRLGDPVLWDYHVLLLTRDPPLVWDMDSALPCPCDLRLYLQEAIRDPPDEYAPAFRVVPADTFLAHFGSDRAHMRGPSGEWRQPPPSWPCVRPEAPTLSDFLDPIHSRPDRSPRILAATRRDSNACRGVLMDRRRFLAWALTR